MNGAGTAAELSAEVGRLRRRLEIEAALESLRVEIAGMRESGDLAGVVRHVERSLRQLGATCDSVGINVIDDDGPTMTMYSASDRGIRVWGPHSLAGAGALAEYVAHWRAGQTYSRLMTAAERRREAVTYRQLTGSQRGLTDEEAQPTSDRWVVDVPFGHGMVAMSRAGAEPLGDDEIALLQRFAADFGLAYARFRDLEAAEGRALELQRQAAYERLRGAVLAARSADDILAADALMAAELRQLGVEFVGCGINVIDEDAGELRFFGAARDQGVEAAGVIALDEPDAAELVRHWRRGEVYARPATHRWKTHVKEVLSTDGVAVESSTVDSIRSLVDAPFSHGTLSLNGTQEAFPAEAIDILQGFAGVVSLAYARYLDFQRLEAQHEQTRQANRLKSDFLARMSHDLRTPMNAILGYVGLLLRKTKGVLDERQYRNLENIRQSGGNMLRLIDYMQDLSRIASEAPDVAVEEVDPRALVGASVEACRRRLPEGVTLSAQLEAVAPLRTDPGRVRQVLDDILDNACKFTAAGSIEVSLRAVEARVEIAVADTGPGIPGADLPHLFDEFYYMARAQSNPGVAGGLSMPRAKKSIELLGGILSVRSRPGQGTTFTIRLGDYESAL